MNIVVVVFLQFFGKLLENWASDSLLQHELF